MSKSYADAVVGNKKEIIIRNNKVHAHIANIQRIMRWTNDIYKYDMIKILDDYIIDCKNESLDELANNLKHYKINFNVMYDEYVDEEVKKQTLLRLAVSKKNLNVVKLLLKCGTDPNFIETIDYKQQILLPSTPLYEAIIRNFIEGIRELVKYKVKLTTPNHEWDRKLHSCLHSVAGSNVYSDDILRELLKCENIREYINVAEKDMDGRLLTPFQTAIVYGQISKVKLLLEHNIDCNTHIEEGYWYNGFNMYVSYTSREKRYFRHPIVFATRLQHYDILELLCSHPKTIFDETVQDAFGIAIWNEDIESVKILLKYIPDTHVMRKELILPNTGRRRSEPLAFNVTYHHILDVINLPMPKIQSYTNTINIIDMDLKYSKLVREKGIFIHTSKQLVKNICDKRRNEITECLKLFLAERKQIIYELTPLPSVLIDLVQQY